MIAKVITTERPKTLSAAFVRTVNTPGRYGDGRGGHGLSLLVKPTKNGRISKSWSQRLRVGGRAINMGLGSYPVVSLAEAREKALANRQEVATGNDPRARRIPVATFEQAAEIVIGIHGEAWKEGGKSEAQWRASLTRYAMPRIGAKTVDSITTADVMAVLTPHWNDKRETMQRVRQRIGAVMKWSVAQGYREDNPAGDAIGAALPKITTRRQHQQALPHSEVGQAIDTVRNSLAWTGTKLAFEFLTVTAARSGEVRLATWDEIDIEKRQWIIPAERMKGQREHRVPLSGAGMTVLEQAASIRDDSGLLFPSPGGKTLTDSTLSKLLRENDVGAVPHGFRSSFRDWAADNGISREIAEACLAHTVMGVEAAYFRSDLYDARRKTMEDWGIYVTQRR